MGEVIWSENLVWLDIYLLSHGKLRNEKVRMAEGAIEPMGEDIKAVY